MGRSEIANFPVLKRETSSQETALPPNSNSSVLFVSLDRSMRGFLLSSRLGTLLLAGMALAMAAQGAAQGQSIRVDITPDHVANKFVPNQALGAGIDRMPAEAIDKLFTPAALERVLSAGWQPVTYRQNTELHIEAW